MFGYNTNLYNKFMIKRQEPCGLVVQHLLVSRIQISPLCSNYQKKKKSYLKEQLYMLNYLFYYILIEYSKINNSTLPWQVGCT